MILLGGIQDCLILKNEENQVDKHLNYKNVQNVHKIKINVKKEKIIFA